MFSGDHFTVDVYKEYFNNAIETIRTYAWPTFLFGFITYFLVTKLIQPYICDHFRGKLPVIKIGEDEQDSSDKYKDKIRKARLQMQEQYEKQRKEYLEKKKEEEERKKLENEKRRSESNPKDGSNNKSPFKNRIDYNPLSGAELRSYRPPKKGCCRGSCG